LAGQILALEGTDVRFQREHEPEAARSPEVAPSAGTPPAAHAILQLQQTVGNAAVARVLARESEASIREEVAGALGVKPDDPRVDVELVTNFEVVRALRDAQRLVKQEPPPPQPATPVLPDAYGGLGVKEFLRRQRLDLLKQEMEKAGLTDEMIAKGFRDEKRTKIGDREFVIVFQLVREGQYGRTVKTFEEKRGNVVERTVTTTDYNKGGEYTFERWRVESGKETLIDRRVDPGSGPLAERAALAKTSTRWIKNPDGTVTIETLDAYGRPIKGRSWKASVFQSPQERLRSGGP
jgi:hypothetical protein